MLCPYQEVLLSLGCYWQRICTYCHQGFMICRNTHFSSMGVVVEFLKFTYHCLYLFLNLDIPSFSFWEWMTCKCDGFPFCIRPAPRPCLQASFSNVSSYSGLLKARTGKLVITLLTVSNIVCWESDHISFLVKPWSGLIMVVREEQTCLYSLLCLSRNLHRYILNGEIFKATHAAIYHGFPFAFKKDLYFLSGYFLLIEIQSIIIYICFL